MINIEVVLVLVAAYTRQTLDVKVAFIKDDQYYSLPREFLTNSSDTLGVAAYLLNRHMNMKALLNGTGFVPLLQKRLIDNTERTEDGYRCIAVPYLGLIPEFIPVPEYIKWIPISKLNTLSIYKDHAQIVAQTLKEKTDVRLV